MDLQTVFTEAVQLHSQGQLQQAKEKYLQVLRGAPENSNVLGNLGIVCRDLGQHGEAQQYCSKAVVLAPHDPNQLINLGAVYEADGKYGEAAATYLKVLQGIPGHPKALNNMGKVLHLQGKVDEGLSYLKQAVAIEPDYPVALNNIGVILSEKGETEEAVPYLEKSYSLDSHNPNTLFNLAGAYNVLGQMEKSREKLRYLLEQMPQNQPASHMLAALEGKTTDSAPPEYVAETFDRYAPRFDNHLQNALCYDVPLALADLMEKNLFSAYFERCLDVGCGTGLSAVPFHDRCSLIAGVDLSPRMLEKAAEKNLYSELHCHDIYDFLNNTSESYDLFLAADVFIYLGRLDIFFAHIIKRACQGSVLACSIEHHTGSEKYILRNSGRYAHRCDYLVHEAKCCGFEVLARKEHGIRKENNSWIPGWIFLFQLT